MTPPCRQPSGRHLPVDGPVMVFDDRCTLQLHPDRERRALFREIIRAHPELAS